MSGGGTLARAGRDAWRAGLLLPCTTRPCGPPTHPLLLLTDRRVHKARRADLACNAAREGGREPSQRQPSVQPWPPLLQPLEAGGHASLQRQRWADRALQSCGRRGRRRWSRCLFISWRHTCPPLLQRSLLACCRKMVANQGWQLGAVCWRITARLPCCRRLESAGFVPHSAAAAPAAAAVPTELASSSLD